MVEVTERSANWRLFGGGGLLVAGVLWVVSTLLVQGGMNVPAAWLSVVVFLLLAAAHLFLAFGQTGSNGIVGGLGWGKAALVIAAVGWAVWGVVELLAILGTGSLPTILVIAGALIVLGGFLAAIAIAGRGVAKGIAKWILFVPVLWSAFWLVAALGPLLTIGTWWVELVLGLLYALTGLFYLFNKVDVPR